jgi:vitamin K-dependent gamma-carboxylase
MGLHALRKAALGWGADFFRRRLHEPVDAASLGVFRLTFGWLVIYEVARTVLMGRVSAYFIEPEFHLTYLGFEWVRPLSAEGMYDYFGVFALAGFLVLLGLFYRAAAVVVFLCACYYFLLDAALYLNHMYLFCLVAFLMCFVGANRWAALDRQIFRWDAKVPFWQIFLLRAQMFLVYFYAGIAKINSDWLQGEPVRAWLHNRAGTPLIGPLLPHEPTVYLIAWGGLAFDLSIGFLLCWRRTRLFALPGVFFFHVTNKLLFNIGIFPEFALALTLLFLEPDWPRKVLALFSRLKERLVALAPLPAADHGNDEDWDDDEDEGEYGFEYGFEDEDEDEVEQEQEAPARAAAPPSPPGRQAWGPAFVAVWLAVQLLLPLRHWLYPGDVAWTEEGHRYSWRMKLRDKAGRMEVTVRDPDTGREWKPDPEEHLTPWQINDATTRPDLTQQFARYIRDHYREREGLARAEVYVRAVCTVNRSQEADLIDPTVNLAEEPRNLWPKRWILRAKPPRTVKSRYEPAGEPPGDGQGGE